jgi:hypothetical protein
MCFSAPSRTLCLCPTGFKGKLCTDKQPVSFVKGYEEPVKQKQKEMMLR